MQEQSKWNREITHMCAEFSGMPEKIHGVIASHSLCYQRLVGGKGDIIMVWRGEVKTFKGRVVKAYLQPSQEIPLNPTHCTFNLFSQVFLPVRSSS